MAGVQCPVCEKDVSIKAGAHRCVQCQKWVHQTCCGSSEWCLGCVLLPSLGHTLENVTGAQLQEHNSSCLMDLLTASLPFAFPSLRPPLLSAAQKSLLLQRFPALPRIKDFLQGLGVPLTPDFTLPSVGTFCLAAFETLSIHSSFFVQSLTDAVDLTDHWEGPAITRYLSRLGRLNVPSPVLVTSAASQKFSGSVAEATTALAGHAAALGVKVVTTNGAEEDGNSLFQAMASILTAELLLEGDETVFYAHVRARVVNFLDAFGTKGLQAAWEAANPDVSYAQHLYLLSMDGTSGDWLELYALASVYEVTIVLFSALEPKFEFKPLFGLPSRRTVYLARDGDRYLRCKDGSGSAKKLSRVKEAAVAPVSALVETDAVIASAPAAPAAPGAATAVSSSSSSSSSSQFGVDASVGKAGPGAAKRAKLDSAPASSRGPCRYFARGFCRNEDRCEFSHLKGSSSSAPLPVLMPPLPPPLPPKHDFVLSKGDVEPDDFPFRPMYRPQSEEDASFWIPVEELGAFVPYSFEHYSRICARHAIFIDRLNFRIKKSEGGLSGQDSGCHDERIMAVFDGIGSAVDAGACAKFADDMANECLLQAKHLKTGQYKGLNFARCVVGAALGKAAFKSTDHTSSVATGSVVVLEGNQLHTCTVGDAAFILIRERDNELAIRFSPSSVFEKRSGGLLRPVPLCPTAWQDEPFLHTKKGSAIPRVYKELNPKTGEVVETPVPESARYEDPIFDVEEGDIVVVCSDGLIDNICGIDPDTADCPSDDILRAALNVIFKKLRIPGEPLTSEVVGYCLARHVSEAMARNLGLGGRLVPKGDDLYLAVSRVTFTPCTADPNPSHPDASGNPPDHNSYNPYIPVLWTEKDPKDPRAGSKFYFQAGPYEASSKSITAYAGGVKTKLTVEVGKHTKSRLYFFPYKRWGPGPVQLPQDPPYYQRKSEPAKPRREESPVPKTRRQEQPLPGPPSVSSRGDKRSRYDSSDLYESDRERFDSRGDSRRRRDDSSDRRKHDDYDSHDYSHHHHHHHHHHDHRRDDRGHQSHHDKDRRSEERRSRR